MLSHVASQKSCVGLMVVSGQVVQLQLAIQLKITLTCFLYYTLSFIMISKAIAISDNNSRLQYFSNNWQAGLHAWLLHLYYFHGGQLQDYLAWYCIAIQLAIEFIELIIMTHNIVNTIKITISRSWIQKKPYSAQLISL